MSHTLLLLILLFAMVAINVPIAIALGASAVLVGFMMQGDFGFVGTILFSSLQKIELLAIPFFILAGHVFDRTGIMFRMFRFMDSLIGRVRGSTGLVASGVSVMLGGLSGSGPADTAALGSTLGPVMTKRGYSAPFTAALISAGGSLGLVVPPSVAFILYGIVVPGISIGKMFIAGILPGLLMGLLIAMTSYVISVRRGYDAVNDAFSLSVCIKAFWASVWGLLAPLTIVGGIYFGVFTPTEAAGVAVVYGLLVGLLLHREIGFRDLLPLLRVTAVDTSVVMLIVACASLFSWVLTVDGTIVVIVAGLARDLTAEWQVFLLAGFVLLIAGLFIDGASIYLVLVPMLMPAVRAFQIDLTWFGVFVAVAVAIGQFTPPVGVNLFVAARILDIKFERIIPDVLPFIGVSMLGLVLIYLFPAVSLWLPSTMPN
ncbi:MAG: TRAP transporter large permease [Rhizobiaceae bacterium]